MNRIFRSPDHPLTRSPDLPIRLLLLAPLALLLAVLSLADNEKQLTVYTPQTSYTIPVNDREGQLYLSIMDLVGPLGHATMRVDGHDWKLQFNSADARFSEGKDKAKIRGNSVDLNGKALVVDNRLLIPVKSSFAVLSALLKKNVEFRPEARRILIDNAALHFTAELKKGDKSSLLLSFNQPVHPVTTQNENSVKLIFKREPLVSEITSQPFDDKFIHSLSFSEDNGTASLVIAGGPDLNATVSGDGKSVTIQSAPAIATATPSPVPSPESASTGSTASQSTQPGIGPQTHPSFLVLIDPSHGGNDQGALLPEKLLEKDITLAMARRLKTELEDHGISARLVRDGDVNLSLEQRAEMANGLHAGIYIAIHAGLPGSGVRIYSPAITSATEPVGKFHPWESAQSSYMSRSQALAQAVAEEVGKKQINVVSFKTSLRPLNNITAPAIAVELAPDPANVADLSSQKFQTNVAAGIASGVAHARAQLEAQR